MIKIILGGIGSGKSLLAVKWITGSVNKVFGNFKINRYDGINYSRIKYDDVISLDDKNRPQSVNFEFWEKARKKYGTFHIILDEFHNVMHSRRAMSKNNILLSRWFSQIRKITGSSEKQHLIVISQELGRIDVSIRDLAHEIWYCEKVVMPEKMSTKIVEHGKKKVKQLDKILCRNIIFSGTNCTKAYELWRDHGMKTYVKKLGFIANPYYQYYDSYELITFEEGYL